MTDSESLPPEVSDVENGEVKLGVAPRNISLLRLKDSKLGKNRTKNEKKNNSGDLVCNTSVKG